MPGKQLVGYDITIPLKYYDQGELSSLLHEWCKKWAFQKERGEETGYLHWQVRLHLMKKKTPKAALEEVPIKGKWSITSKGVHQKTSFNYVMKADTRVDGPWTNKDYVVPQKKTRQLREYLLKERHPWQVSMEAIIQQWDDRKINYIQDVRGCNGKSMFVEYMNFKELAKRLPPKKCAQDLLRAAYDMPDSRCYMVDMPRAMKKDNLSEFYAGMETLKDGWVYDDRYAWKSRYMDRPNIVVFANTEPVRECWTDDMWAIWSIDADNVLQEVNDEAYAFA